MKQQRSLKKLAPQGPFSRWFSLDELAGLPGGRIGIEATAEERADLAKANDLPEIKSLVADVHVLIQPREIVLSGEVRARIVQNCVVTLDPFESDLREAIDIRYAPQAAPSPIKGRGKPAEKIAPPDHDALADDPPEPLPGDHIDLGAVAAEFFALGLDPYPRKPGAEFAISDEEVAAGKTDEERKNPFAALASLRTPKSR